MPLERGHWRGVTARIASGADASISKAARGTTPRAIRGFTLLEVLVAILLLSLALTAVVRLAGREARATAHLRDTTFAQWVAANALAETRLADAFPAVGRREGETLLGNRRWRWQLDVQGTDEPSIRRLEVQVFLADETSDAAAPVAGLTGFAAQR
jgi:general secretion pathway protein I